MKKSVVALAVMALGVTSVHAAEIYNKDGNKLDLYGKVKAAHSWTDGTNADEPTHVWVFAVRRKSTINWPVTGNLKVSLMPLKQKVHRMALIHVWRLLAWIMVMTSVLTMVATMVSLTMWELILILSQSSAVTPLKILTASLLHALLALQHFAPKSVRCRWWSECWRAISGSGRYQ